MAGLAEAVEAVSVMTQAVSRDPESPDAAISVAQTVQNIDWFLTSPEITAILRVDPARRRALAEQLSRAAQPLFASLRTTLSVAVQVQQLGGRVDWGAALGEAIDRIESALAHLGVFLDPSTMPAPPMVTRSVGDDGRPRFGVVEQRIRRPQLEPYIALALQQAKLSELEPGHWFAELEGFPGVWADGASSEECLAALADVLHEWLIIKVAHGDRDLLVLGNLDPRMLILLG